MSEPRRARSFLRLPRRAAGLPAAAAAGRSAAETRTAGEELNTGSRRPFECPLPCAIRDPHTAGGNTRAGPLRITLETAV